MTNALSSDTVQIVQDGETDIIIRRDFTHPPARVWRALTEPPLIRQWLSPQQPLRRCEMDARAGGSFRYEWADFYFSGPVLEVDAPHRMVHVEHFNGDTSSGPTVTTDLLARSSGTRMTVRMRYPDAAARAAAIEGGFTDSIDEVYGRIEGISITD